MIFLFTIVTYNYDNYDCLMIVTLYLTGIHLYLQLWLYISELRENVFTIMTFYLKIVTLYLKIMHLYLISHNYDFLFYNYALSHDVTTSHKYAFMHLFMLRVTLNYIYNYDFVSHNCEFTYHNYLYSQLWLYLIIVIVSYLWLQCTIIN